MKENKDKKSVEKTIIKHCKFRKVSDYTVSINDEENPIIETYEEIQTEKTTQ